MDISIVKSAEHFDTEIAIHNTYWSRDDNIRIYATTDVGTKYAKTSIFYTTYFSQYNIDKIKMFVGVGGYRHIVFANGLNAQCITLINLDKRIGYEYEFGNATNINIDDVVADTGEFCVKKHVKIIGTLTYFDKDEVPTNDVKFAIHLTNPKCEFYAYDFEITDMRFDQEERAKIVESFRSINQKSVAFVDYAPYNRSQEKEARDDSDDEMEVLSVPENAFFKEFRELMDKISSHVLSYGASINMSSNDRIKVCSFIDSINEVIEKYNKK